MPERPPRPGGLCRCAGFSLLEVLVAFAILAIALGVLLQIFSGSIRNTLVSDAYAKAADVAESALALAGTELPLEPGRQSGEEGEFKWELEVEPRQVEGFSVPPDRFDSYLVTVRVHWPGGDRQRAFTLSTLRLALRGN